MATEKLKFKLELFATMWDKPPHVEIFIGDTIHYKGDITGTETDPNVIQFEQEVNEGETYTLTIKRTGKTSTQTIVNAKGDIIKDQLLNTKRIEIDEIDIGGLVYDGVYTPDYPEPWFSQQKKAGVDMPESFNNVTKMGHNGSWKFTFQSPFYMWLLENLY